MSAANGVAHEAAADTFRASDLVITKTKTAKAVPQNAKFGTAYSDHMFTVEFTEGEGWGVPEIKPFADMSIHPGCSVLHYGMSCFEGMKAYRGPDGVIRLFRPTLNMQRFVRSCNRLMLAKFDPDELLKCIVALVKLDERFVPEGIGQSLYLRPFAMSTDPNLGLKAPSKTLVSCIMSPTMPFFGADSKPVDIFLDEEFVRAWPGGAGQYKLASNYAPTVSAQAHSIKKHGCPMSIFCLPMGSSIEDAVVSEGAGMNLFFFIQNEEGTEELSTPPLDGTILPGVTRRSVIETCTGWGEFPVKERYVTVGELSKASVEGRLLEVFGVGTAVSVAPIGSLKRDNGTEMRCKREDCPLGKRVYKAITDIQYGIVESDWAVPI